MQKTKGAPGRQAIKQSMASPIGKPKCTYCKTPMPPAWPHMDATTEGQAGWLVLDSYGLLHKLGWKYATVICPDCWQTRVVEYLPTEGTTEGGEP